MRAGLLVYLLATIAPTANSQWVRHERHGQIEVFAEFDLNTQALISRLQAVADELQQTLEVAQPTRPIQIVLYSSPRRYRAELANLIPESAFRRALFYRNGDVFQIYASRGPELMTDLRHEFTHAVLHQALPWIPLWIDEGLAEYFEETPAERTGSARLAGIKWKSRTGWSPSLQQLEKIPAAEQMDAADYRDSWAWVTYLLHDSETSRDLLRDYLLAVSAGEAPGLFSTWATGREPLVIKGVGSYFRRFHISLR